jgi:hypothetical protein
MNARDTVQSLLVLRKLTRAIADTVRSQMTEYLVTATPLLRPAAVLGDYVQGGVKEAGLKAERAFKEVQALYLATAPAKPFNLPRDLATPFSFPSAALEINPVEYVHVAEVGATKRNITVRCPLSWVLSYSGYAPSRFQELAGSSTKMRATDELQKLVLGQVILHVALQTQPGLLHMLEGLHFPVTTHKSPELGDLPITRIGAAISTTRPPDAVVVESAEMTGVDAFEEVVTVEEIARLSNPLRDRLLAIAREQAPELALG